MEVGEAGSSGDDFEAVFARHAPFALRVLRRFGVAESDLPDACQDAFLVVHRKLPDFEGRSALSTWLYRICARVASDYRKRAHRRYETEPLCGEPAASADAGRTAELAEMVALLERVLDGLEDDKRQVFVLYELEELPMVEIARIVGCPVKTGFSRLYAARARINAALARMGCATLVVPLLPVPVRALGQPALRRALEAVLPASPFTAPTPLVAGGATAAGAVAATGAGSIGAWSACAMVTLASLLLTLDDAGPGPRGAVMASAGSDPATVLAARAVTPSLPVVMPAARPPPRAHERPRPRRRVPAPASAQAVAPTATPTPTSPPTTFGEWLEAPAVAPEPEHASNAVPAVGLDAVLDATSIRSTMRFGPRDERARWALVPHEPR